jgi:hypothetical protein
VVISSRNRIPGSALRRLIVPERDPGQLSPVIDNRKPAKIGRVAQTDAIRTPQGNPASRAICSTT